MNRTHLLILLFATVLIAATPRPLFSAEFADPADQRIAARLKTTLLQAPREGPALDRLYQLYLEGPGVDRLISELQSEAQSDSPKAHLFLGHLHRRQGQMEKALASYRAAAALAPDDYYPRLLSGEMLNALGRFEGAIEPLSQAAQLSQSAPTLVSEDLVLIFKSLGTAYFERDQLEPALEAWKKIVELDPNNLFSRLELAELFEEQELYDQAITEHQAIAQLQADVPYRVCLSLRQIGRLREKRNDYDSALQSYDAALELVTPDNWLWQDLHDRIQRIYSHNGDFAGLTDYYRKKLERSPNDLQLIGLLARAYLGNQQIDEAIAQYRAGLERAPGEVALRLNLIAALRQAARHEEMAQEYERLTRDQPGEIGFYRELGELYLQMQQPERARAAYQRLIEQAPEDPRRHAALAEIYAKQNWHEEAEAAYQKAIALAPDNLDYLEYLGDYYLGLDEKEKALAAWQGMVKGARATAPNYDRLARLLDAKGYLDEAIEANLKAAELAPDQFEYRRDLAQRWMARKNYEAAARDFQHAARLAPNKLAAEQLNNQLLEIYRQQGLLPEKIAALAQEPESFDQQRELASMHLKLGNLTEGIEALSRAVTLNPADIPAHRQLLGLHERVGQTGKVLDCYQRLIEIDAVNAREYWSGLSEFHLKMLDIPSARRAAERAIASSPRNPEGHELMARIARLEGDFEAAITSLKEAMRIQRDSSEVRKNLAEIYWEAGQGETAIQHYWRAWDLAEETSAKVGLIGPLSEVYYGLNRGGELEAMLKRLAEKTPSDPAPVLALAEWHKSNGNFAAAREQLLRALEQSPQNSSLLFQLVQLSVDLGESETAIDFQQRLIAAQPDPNHRFRLGELLFDLGREQEAIQTWSDLILEGNQSLESELKLAKLMIRYGLDAEARGLLEGAGEKSENATALYEIGSLFAELDERDLAFKIFNKILRLPEPPVSAASTNQVPAPAAYATAASMRAMPFHPGLIPPNTLSLPHQLQSRLHAPSPYGSTANWSPNTWEEAKAAALAHLVKLAQEDQKLEQWIDEFKNEAERNPTDLIPLRQLAQIFQLTNQKEEFETAVRRLAELSPQETQYITARLEMDVQNVKDLAAAQRLLAEIRDVLPDHELAYRCRLASTLHFSRKTADAVELLDLASWEKLDPKQIPMVLNVLVQCDQLDKAEELLGRFTAHMSSAAGPAQLTANLTHLYQSLANARLQRGQTEQTITHLWKCFEAKAAMPSRTAGTPGLSASMHSINVRYGLQQSFPSANAYIDGSLLSLLQNVFTTLWIRDELQPLVAQFEAAFQAPDSSAPIQAGLALSYIHWWSGQGQEALAVMRQLQERHPQDAALKLVSALGHLHQYDYERAIVLLEELAKDDPRQRAYYYNLMTALAVHTGNSAKAREMLGLLMNLPLDVHRLMNLSQTFQQAGLITYAIAPAQKAKQMAMASQDPNLLMQLGQQLEQLGRGQDSAHLATRALRFVNRPGRGGRTLHSYQFQRALNLSLRNQNLKQREEQLLQAASQNTNSFLAQLNLANFYQSTRKTDQAIQAFEQALALRPNDETTRQRFAEMLTQERRMDKAVGQYQLLLKSNPNALGYNYWQVVNAFFEAGKVQEICQIAYQAISPSTRGYNYGNNLAQQVAQRCMNPTHAQEAIRLLERLIEVEPHNSYHLITLASARAVAGETEKAKEILHEKLATPNEDPRVHAHLQTQIALKLAEFYQSANELPKLIQQFQERLDQNPEDLSLVYLLASLHLKAGKPETAEPFIQKLMAATHSADASRWFMELAESLQRAGQREREAEILEHSLRQQVSANPYELAQSMERLGRVYVELGKRGQGEALLRKMAAVRLAQQSGNAVHEKQRLAQMFRQLEMKADAERYYSEILNDLGAQSYQKEQAQRELAALNEQNLLSVKKETTPAPPGLANPGVQRALAMQHFQRNELVQAEKIFGALAEATPDDLESRSKLAEIYTRQSKHEQAIQAWEKLIEADPENTQFQDGLISAYQAGGRTEQALQLAKKLVAQEESSVHYNRLARVYGSANRLPEAIASYEKSLQLGPGDFRVYRDLANLHKRARDFAKAEKTLTQAFQFASHSYERDQLSREVMELYRAQGKTDEFYEKAEKEGWLSAGLIQERAENEFRRGNLEIAAEGFEKAIELATQDYERKRFRGRLMEVYAKLGRTEEALKLYEGISFDPGSSTSITYGSSGLIIHLGSDDARQKLISAYQQQGKQAELLAYFVSKNDSTPNNAPILEMLAEIHRASGDHAKAAQAYQELAKARPDDVRSIYYAAGALQKAGQTDPAQELLKKAGAALIGHARSQDAWYLAALATVAAEGQFHDRAIELFQEAIKASGSHTNNEWTLQSLYRSLGHEFIAAEQFNAAVEAFKKAVGYARDDYSRQQMQGDLRMAFQKAGQAGQLLAKQIQAAQDRPDDPQVHFDLAQTFDLNADYAKAVAAYERVLELQPSHAPTAEALTRLYPITLESTTQFAKKAAAIPPAIQRNLAKHYQQHNDAEKAAVILEQLVEGHPDDDSLRQELAGTLTRQSHHEKALNHWKKLHERHPKQTSYVSGLVAALQSTGQPREALALAQTHAASVPTPEASRLLAQAQASANQLQEAVKTYLGILEKDPASSNDRDQLAQLYARLGDWDAAEAAYLAALESAPDDWRRQMVQRNLLDLLKLQDRTGEWLQKIGAESDPSFQTLMTLAQHYQAVREPERAIDAFEKALALNPQTWERERAATQLIDLCIQAGKLDQAVQAFLKLPRSESHSYSISTAASGLQVRLPDDRVRENLLKAFQDQNRLPELIPLLEGEKSQAHQRVRILELLAEARQTLKHHGQAAASYLELIPLNASDRGNFFKAAAAFKRDGQTEKARELIQRGLASLDQSTSHESSMSLAYLAAICASGGLNEEAARLYQKALDSTGSSDWMRSNLLLSLGLVLRKTGQKEEAIAAFQEMLRAARNARERDQALAELQETYQKSGRINQIVEEHREAAAKQPGDPDVQFRLGQILESSGKRDEAVQAYEKALELNPESAQILEALARSSSSRDLKKAIQAYQKLLALDSPPSERIQRRRQLVDYYIRLPETEPARHWIEEDLQRITSPGERETALLESWRYFEARKDHDTALLLYQNLAARWTDSAALQELLGNTLRAAGRTEAARAAYERWYALRRQQADQQMRSWDFRLLADALLEKGILPDRALESAETAFRMDKGAATRATYAWAATVNGQYETAAREWKIVLKESASADEPRLMWRRIIQAASAADDEKAFETFVQNLSPRDQSTASEALLARLALAEFHRSRQSMEQANAHFAQTGFLNEKAWWLIGPFPNEEGRGFAKEFLPESKADLDLTSEHDGALGPVRWQRRQDSLADGLVDLNEIFGPSLNWVAAYAYATVHSSQERTAQIRFGSDDQAKVWLNGKQVLAYDRPRAAALDQDIVSVTLKAGPNRILVKVCDESVHWGFYFRITDPDGQPIRDLQLTTQVAQN